MRRLSVIFVGVALLLLVTVGGVASVLVPAKETWSSLTPMIVTATGALIYWSHSQDKK